MKRLVVLTFAAAVAAVAFGGEVPSSWYIPEGGYKTQNTETWYTKTVGKQTLKYRCVCNWVNINGELAFAHTWDDPPGEPDNATAAAIERALESEFLARTSQEEITQLAQTVYDNAITRIEPSTEGFVFYTTGQNGKENNGSSINIPKYTIKGEETSTVKKYHLMSGTTRADTEEWYGYPDSDDYSLSLATVEGALKGKLEIKGWNIGGYDDHTIAEHLKDGTSLSRCQVLMRDGDYNVKYVNVGQYMQAEDTNAVTSISTYTDQSTGLKYYKFAKSDGKEIKINGSTSMPIAKEYKVVDVGGNFSLQTSDGEVVEGSKSWSTNFNVKADEKSIEIDHDDEDKIKLYGFDEGTAVAKDLAECLTDGEDYSNWKLVVRSEAGENKSVAYMDIGSINQGWTNSVHSITQLGTGDSKYYVFKDVNGKEVKIKDSQGTVQTMSVPHTYEVAEDDGVYTLKNDNDTTCGVSWIKTNPPDNISLTEYEKSTGDTRVEITGWHDADAGDEKTLAEMLTDGSNHLLFYRGTGGVAYPTYFKIGKLAPVAIAEADELSIHKAVSIAEATTNLEVVGFADASVGAVPFKAPAGEAEGAKPAISWTSVEDKGAIFVSGGEDAAPRFTKKTERNYYYGTSRPADPGETVLGWHELPNVTTNYVEGDERTITSDSTTNVWTGEICKKVKLYKAPEGGAVYDGNVYAAYMDDEDHIAWSKIAGANIAPLIADGITTISTNGALSIKGFADATDISYLRKASSNSVEWASLGGLVAAKHGIVLEPNTNSQFIVAMQNYTNAATRSTHTAQNNVLLSRNEDGDLEWLTDVDMVGLQSVIGIGAVKAEPDGQISSAYDVKLRPSSDMGTVITGVDNDGNWTRMEVAGMMTNYWHLLPRDVVTNLVNDIYVKRAGDDMFGPLEIRAGLTATTAGFNEMTSGVAVVTGAMSADTLTVTNVCNLPFFDQTFVSYGTNETGEVLSCDLNEFTAMVAGDVAAVAAAEKVSEATNAMAQAWTVDTLNVNYTANLGVATTIGGEYPALVESGNSQIKFYVDDTSGELHVKAGERHWKVQMTEVFGPTP